MVLSEKLSRMSLSSMGVDIDRSGMEVNFRSKLVLPSF